MPLPAKHRVHRPRGSHLPLLWPTRVGRAARATKVQIPGGPSPSSMGQRYTDRWDRMPAIERWWAVAGDLVGHVPVPASGALAPIGVAMAMATIDLGGTPQLAARAERRALGVWESAGNGRFPHRLDLGPLARAPEARDKRHPPRGSCADGVARAQGKPEAAGRTDGTGGLREWPKPPGVLRCRSCC